MARTNSRVVLNRSRLDQITLAVADGTQAVGEEIVSVAEPFVPDDPTTAERIIGGAGTWVNGRKVAGQAQKPRGAKVKDHTVVTLVGWPFPARFNERGTVHQPARPFGAPAMHEVIPKAAEIMEPVVRPALKR